MRDEAGVGRGVKRAACYVLRATCCVLREGKRFFTQHAARRQSGDRPPAVEADNLAGDVAAARAEEMDDLGDVLRGARAGQGDALQVLLPFLLRVVVRPLDDPGGDA